MCIQKMKIYVPTHSKNLVLHNDKEINNLFYNSHDLRLEFI